ncbi:glutathione S-transferase family protein [Litoreibacter roseus]|uniref:Glutathione S-transferase n=1 Tax=Litoreibacter roseus TaxID=2601869 RepID=A0A6N6JJY3_9RHOB|nr:glutathione S-transferase [Litoreibacter roseus]GFE66257.1 glutathione S-transferase [Litoreibacter roseus]
MYKVFGTVKSRAFRVLWALQELDQPYDYVPSLPGDADVRAMNGTGKVPAMLDGDVQMTDSTAIITYLADKHQNLTHPAGTKERAAQDALTHTVLDEFDAILWTAAKHSFVLPEDRRVPAVKETLRWEFETNAARMGARLGDKAFLMGDQITVPDIVLTHCLGWSIIAKLGLNDPALSDYLSRMKARDAYKAAAAS